VSFGAAIAHHSKLETASREPGERLNAQGLKAKNGTTLTKALAYDAWVGLRALLVNMGYEPQNIGLAVISSLTHCAFATTASAMMKCTELGVILLAEDSEVDVLMTRRAFAKIGLINPLHVVSDGEEAIAYLSGVGKYANRSEYPLPVLLLLDLRMPRKNGLEVLRWIRQQPTLRALRVIVLTTSDLFRDVNEAYQLGANSYIVKPVDLDQFVRVSQALKGYWLWLNETPEISRPGTTEPRRTEPSSGDGLVD
jgi:CheY-like chemotaxis protein